MSETDQQRAERPMSELAIMFTAEEGYDVALVDYSDLIRALLAEEKISG